MFNDSESILDFHRNYNGHKFVDSKGNEYFAAVEFAPFQKFADPAKKKRMDQRLNTIGSGNL